MAEQITVTLPDSSTREVATGTTPAEIAAAIGARLAKDAIAARVDGDWVDLNRPITHDARVAIITPASDDGREVLRHSTAHVLAQAVLGLFPGAKYAIGPAIDNGFYYDFELPDHGTFSEDDLARIEDEMRRIVAADQRFEREDLDYDEGLALFGDQPFKQEIITKVRQGAADAEEADEVGPIDEFGGVSVYRNVDAAGTVDFTDLCRGPHVPSTGRLGAFKLMRVAGAYWRGNEKGPQLQYASTAPRGRTRRRSPSICTGSRKLSGATIASSVPSSTCSASPTRSGRVSRCSILAAASSAR